ncbi:SusC/RagA family TonB-linked outer membrane protein [Marinifilum sp.]|uniref:SusC/RagA family TonB-linked outer membrane protein n=1 Tax=Marinifilum sp. TaxID=2033137 RepID=UPI003BA8E203
MKLTLMLLILGVLQVSADVYSQNAKINVKVSKMELSEFLWELQQNSEVVFVYRTSDLEGYERISLERENASITDVLDVILSNTNLEYKFDKDVIVITKKQEEIVLPFEEQEQKKTIKGKVTDKGGVALPGVSVTIKGSYVGTATNMDGIYQLKVSYGEVLFFSFVGMASKEVTYTGQSELNVVLEEDATQLTDVVVNGYFSRKAESYTGNATVVKGMDIMKLNPMSVFEAIAILDPDVMIQENNLSGSDPNNPASIHIQGTGNFNAGEINGTKYTSDFVGDPNLPTFIVDGFEQSFEIVNDIDPNRIATMSILKDAAATAVYGSRAANGIIVITTIAPKPGRVDVVYNTNIQFSFPDLSTYEYLNAREKFELEQALDATTPYYYEWEYNRITKWLAEGVDTDWLAKPTRNGVSQNHTLNIMGGVKTLRYNIGLNYSDDQGVMKGSKRSNYSVNADIHYRPNDKLTFKNSVSYARNNSVNSPYGTFQTYTEMNPFFPTHDANDELVKNYSTTEKDGRADYMFRGHHINPLYEATVGNFDESGYSNFIENFGLDWSFTEDLRAQLNLYYSEQNSTSDNFISPESNAFNEVNEAAERGSYQWTHTLAQTFSGRASLGYIKQVNAHHFTFNLGYEIAINKNESNGYKAIGFGNSDMSHPSFAAGFDKNGVPLAGESTVRTMGAYLSTNYTWDNRFLFDASLRYDGSSQFGENKKVAPFYSFGLGWNLHEEAFLKGNDIINQLKIRGTYGETGSIKFSAYQAIDTYNYYKDLRYFDNLGLYIMALGNEDLRWQTTNDMNFGIDLSMFKNRFNANFNYYLKKTTDMVVQVSTPPSIGFEGYMENLGEMENKGFSFSARYDLIRKKDFNLNIFVNGSQNRNKILSISNALKRFNEASNTAHENDNQFTSDRADASHLYNNQFREGKSTTAIYAVQSLGINPTNGEELFLNKDGSTTYEWDASQKVIAGNTAPDLQGSMGLNVRYKNFIASANFQYSIGSQAYNHTLVSKVENAYIHNNVDRRVLEDTWMQPGDVKPFGNPNGAYSYASSRFVQDNDWLRFSSLSLSYDFDKTLINKIGMRSLRLSINTNDLVYWSTIKRERGTSYPFARSFTVGLRTNF